MFWGVSIINSILSASGFETVASFRFVEQFHKLGSLAPAP